MDVQALLSFYLVPVNELVRDVARNGLPYLFGYKTGVFLLENNPKINIA